MSENLAAPEGVLDSIKSAGDIDERIARARELALSAETETAAMGYFITAIRGSNVTSPQYEVAYAMLKVLRAFNSLPGKQFKGSAMWMADLLYGISLYLRCKPTITEAAPASMREYRPTTDATRGIKATADATATLLSHSLERIEFKYQKESSDE